MSNDIPLFQIAWDGDDVRNVVDSITRGSYWANGPYIEQFEAALEEYLDIEHAVVFNSGTTALVSALTALGIGHGDEVIVPSFTFISTANSVQLSGGTPVFADIETGRYGLDPDSVANAITADTAAILPVHYSGKPYLTDEIQALAHEHDIPVLEDAAEALGAETGGQKVGTIGDIGVYSFCQNKIITTGEGGAAVTDDPELADELRLLRSHGRASADYFDSASGGEYVTLGNNFRMSDMVASIGVAQMEKIEDIISRRRKRAGMLSDDLGNVAHVEPPSDSPDGRHVYQLYTVTFADHVDRNSVSEYLADRGIASKVYFDPVHKTNFYQSIDGYRTMDLDMTNEISSRVLSLPMYPDLPLEDVDRIVSTIERAIDETSKQSS